MLNTTRVSLMLLLFLLQEQALHAGISAFKCMLCRDKELFQQEMLCMGIRIPKRLVAFHHSPEDRRVPVPARPEAVPALLALHCLMSLGFSNMGE